MDLSTMKIKQAIIFRKDLKMSPGKMVAQGAHAAVEAVAKASLEAVERWRRNGITKVVLRCADEKELYKLYKKAVSLELPAAIIVDEGRTEVKPGSVTALGIGPGEIDEVTGDLKLW
jgi:peptidyl-tRNA hydrolase, PTH2 family